MLSRDVKQVIERCQGGIMEAEIFITYKAPEVRVYLSSLRSSKDARSRALGTVE